MVARTKLIDPKMLPRNRNLEKTLLSDRLNAALENKGMSLQELADATDMSYEYVRRLVKGEAVPSVRVLRDLARVLSLDQQALIDDANADRLKARMGDQFEKMLGKNPELAPIERFWDRLTEEQKQTVTTLVRTLAASNTATAVSA